MALDAKEIKLFNCQHYFPIYNAFGWNHWVLVFISGLTCWNKEMSKAVAAAAN